jgi:rubrerythrin
MAMAVLDRAARVRVSVHKRRVFRRWNVRYVRQNENGQEETMSAGAEGKEVLCGADPKDRDLPKMIWVCRNCTTWVQDEYHSKNERCPDCDCNGVMVKYQRRKR